MRRPDQVRALSAASLIRHEDNKKLTTMGALAFTIDVPTVLLLRVLLSPSETRESAFRLRVPPFTINRRAVIERRTPGFYN